ncbi:phenoloxidase-activating factor 2-like isoform X2 [Argiope bruennichi]|uniref:phenoloxidase-activating factor 2-like isoform X2 n=1 Tax=Argiope bruennichi TaxID=94029 RepID=UPI002494A86A|nr:phenoloxidase-activating factor 2-like isoform X2 [Argiope bruennichi]
MVVLCTLFLVTVAVGSYGQSQDAPESCLCVPFYQCRGGVIVTDGSTMLDPRSPDGLSNGSPPLTGIPKCDPYFICCLDPETSRVTPFRHKCGNRNEAGTNPFAPVPNKTSISEFGEFPWQAAILKVDAGVVIFKCGGALIDDRHIITSAQCVYKFLDNKNSMIVRLGEWNIEEEDEYMPHEDYGVQDIFIHNRYNPSNLRNDIAVVRLNDTVQFKSYIDTICLPEEDDDFTGQLCVVTGWGADKIKKGTYSSVLKKVVLPVIDKRECQDLLRGTRLGPRFQLHHKFMCAGGEADQDVCKGDAGGPLICYKSDNSYAVAGLVSWGIECGIEKVPGVYTEVKNFIDFITCKTQKPIKEYWRS